MTVPEIIHVPITIDLQSPGDGIQELMKVVRPAWTHYTTKPFTDGLTNALYAVSRNDLTVLVRIFGPGSEKFIDRRLELTTLQLLSEHACAEPVYASFENGLCYGYADGEVLSVEKMRDVQYAELIAGELAKIHSIPLPNQYASELKKGVFIEGSLSMIKTLPEKLDNEEKNTLYQKHVLKDQLINGLMKMERVADSFGEDFVVCHHDLFNRNIVYNRDDNSIKFIDFEYAGPGLAAMDIGCHFMYYIGVEEPDLEAYPSKTHQLHFLRVYLEERNKYSERPVVVTDDLVELWYQRVGKMVLMGYLYWGLWCVHQYGSSIHDEKYGFLEMGCKMLERFTDVIDETLAA